MSIRLERNVRADGKVVAVGGKAFVRNVPGSGYPAPGSNQSGNLCTAVGTDRLSTDGKTVEFVPDADQTEAFAKVKAADEATGTE